MADRAHEPHDLAVPEDGRDDGDVEEVPGAEPRIVGDQHVAGLERLGRVPVEQRLHGPRQGQVEDRHRARRMRQRLALRIEELAGEILRLGDDEREGGAADGEPHLLDDGDEAAPHDLERDRIRLRSAPPPLDGHVGRDADIRCSRRRRSRCAGSGCRRRPLVAGGTIVVDSRSSTMAGPSIASPGARA